MRLGNSFVNIKSIPIKNYNTINKNTPKTNPINSMPKNNIYFTSRFDDDMGNASLSDIIASIIGDKNTRLSGTEYYPEEVELIRETLDMDDSHEIRKKFYEDRLQALMEEKGVLIGGERLFADILSFGFAEVATLRDKHYCNDLARKWVNKLELMRTDLLQIQAAEKNAETYNKQTHYLEEARHHIDVNNIKEKEFYPKLLDKIQARKEGKDVEVPNCIMLQYSNEDLKDNLVEWCKTHVNGNFSQVNAYEDDLVDVLENAEERYSKTKEWNVIYVQDMDKLINPDEVEDYTIEGMKAIMCSTAEDYHTTLLFSTTNPDKLDDTAIESNRVTKIDASNVKIKEENQKRRIANRLGTEQYKNTPLATINDILLYIDCPDMEKYKLNFNSTREQLSATKNFLVKELKKRELNEFLEILNKAYSDVWFIV